MMKKITDYLGKMNDDQAKDGSPTYEWTYERSLIEASLDAYVTIDENGIIKDVNTAAELITGISRNHLINSEFSMYFSERQKAENAYKQTFSEGKICNFGLNLVNIDGSTTPILIHASIYKNAENKAIGVLCNLRDISSTRKIEDELIHLKNNLEQFVKQRAAELSTANIELAQQIEEKKIKEVQTNILKEQNIELEIQKKQLDEASHLKSTFLSNMSHELRTPLHAIVGFTDLTLKTNLNIRQRNYLSKIKTLSHTLLELISDILDLSKIEAGKLELEMTIFDLDEVMQNAVNQVNTKSQEKGLELTYSIDEGVPLNLRGDSLRLGQILNNLVSNAVKFTEKGKVVIQVKCLENYGSNILIQFSVKDTGIGMSELQMRKLFQPFSQADTSTSRKYGGTGLGLSISHELINMMQGEVWVESSPGEGSTFFFTVKIEIADKKHFKKEFDKWGIKVLVVDNQNEEREKIGNMLSEMTLDVTLCTSGKEALSLLENAKDNLPYDLVIMEWKMNDIDGIETARRIKQLFAFKKAPKIILMTASSSQKVQEMAEQIGLHEGLLTKPITPSLLFNSIIQVCFKEDSEQAREVIDKKNVKNTVPHLLNTKVLLVEDNEINREVAQEILQEAGLDVTLAHNGQEAVEMVNTKSFDVVLMDIQMPIMDGYDATREIRKNSKFEDLPIIAMTANALLSDQLDCYNAGMNDHIAKPIDINQLFYTIALWVNKDFAVFSETPHFAELNTIRMASPGIDLKSGLNRLGGNQRLYLKLLDKFHKNHKHDIEEIHYALAHEDLKTASILVHSIKGAAGNLSIQDVYLDSDSLENAFKINRLNFVDLLLEKLEQSLEQSFTTILSLENVAISALDSERSEDHSFDMLAHLNMLENLIDDNDIEAFESIDEIVKHSKGFGFAKKAEALKELIDQYDYDQARPAFDEMNLLIRKELNDGK